MIHCLLNFSDSSQTIECQMHPLFHHQQDGPKFNELILFCRNQWICFKERHDLVKQVVQTEDVVRQEIFLVIVVSSISIDLSAFKEALDQLKSVDTFLTLYDRKSRLKLPAQSHRSISLDGATKAAFSVDEADDPLLDPWPFLLIVRT